MTTDKSILLRMEEQGRKARRIRLRGTERGGTSTARYEILGELARGATGVVHKGRDNDVGRDVALKVLLEQHLYSPELVQRFVEEAQIGGQLQHPGIVPVYELGLRADKRPYFAMKLVKGETLAARLAARRDPADGRRELLAVFREVCRTIAYAHARGVIHRDLKPSNVMIGSFGEVQVVDWGFAKVLRRGGVADEKLADKAGRASTMISTVRSGAGSTTSVAGSVMGTPAYMPPEQALGRVDDLDEQSDIFSLGAILCEILTGKPAYAGAAEDRMTAAAQALLEPAHARLDACDADPRLVALCRQCLQPVPKDRPATAQVLADEVAAFLTDAEGRAHRAQVRALVAEAQAEAQRRGRRLTRLIGSSVVAVLLIAAGAWFWIDAKRTERERERQSKIELALQDASRLRAAKQWPEALAAAHRALALGDDGALARTIEQEATAANTRAKLEREDEALLAELQEIRARHGEEYDAKSTDNDYVAAIERRWPDFRIDVERLRATPRALAFAAVFDAWAHLRRTSKQLRKKDWRKIDALARAIDPKHDGLRDALVSEDPSELVQRAASDEVLELPPALLATIGTVLIDADRRDEGMALLQRAQRKYPGDSWIHHRLGKEASRRNEHALALRHFTATLALQPHSIEARHRIGIALDELGDLERAIAVWRDALRRQPDWAHGLSHIAAVLRKQGKLAEAEAMFREAVDRRPRDPRGLDWLGGFLTRFRRYDEAIECFENALTLEKSPAIYGNLCIALTGKGENERAVQAARTALDLAESDEDRALAHGRIGWALRVLQPAAAIPELQNAIRLDPTKAEYHRDLGDALRRISKLDEAEESARRAIQLDRDAADGYEALREVLLQKGDLQGALRAGQKAIAVAPGDVSAHFRLGALLCDKLRRYDDAIKHFQHVVGVDPTHAEAYDNLATAQREKGDLVAALEAHAMALQLDRNDAHAHINYGVTLSRKGRPDDAMRAYETALSLDPDKAHKALAYANMGSIWFDRGQPRRAIRLFSRALELEPALPYAFVHNMLGKALIALGEHSKAIEPFHRAIALEPWTACLRVNLGATLWRCGRPQEAIEQFLEALEVGPTHAPCCASLAMKLLNAGELHAALRAYRKTVALHPPFARARKPFDRLLRLEQRLPAILKGDDEPDDWRDVLAAAQLAVDDHAGALRLFRRGFEMRPRIDDDPRSRLRYKAARVAVLAGTEAQALAWLRADLAAWEKILAKDAGRVAQALAHWKKDRDLAAVRDGDDLSTECEQLWSDVDTLLQKARDRQKD